MAKPAVVLIGAPGAGKSRIGKRIAKSLDLPFIDTDQRIVAQHGVIADIFATHGEPHFRGVERVEVEKALHEHAVVSLGGGAVLDPQTQAELSQLNVVQLVVSEEQVAPRLANDKRPLIGGDIEKWKALVEARKPLYDSLSTLIVDTSTRPATTIAEEIAHWVKEHND
jgi:shikimate kinase